MPKFGDLKISTEQERQELKRNLIIGGTAAVIAGAYLIHRGRINNLTKLSQAAVEDTMINSFNEGIKYGLNLAKETALFGKDAEQVKDASMYAFSAFDKTG